jgi:hypothetical protein
MDNAVQDGISMSGVREAGKPLTHGNLGTYQGGDMPKAIIKDLEQITGFRSRDGIAHPVIEDEQIDLCQAGEAVREG